MAHCSALCALTFIFVALSACSVGWCLLPGQQELLTFQRSHSYNDTKSDLIFLVDTSGSLMHYVYQNGRYYVKNGFDDEKVFVNSLLNYIRISLPATRVSVILFSTKAHIDINYISHLSPNNHKCNFKIAFQRLPFRSGMTNMNQAFHLANDIIFGHLSGPKRPTAVVKTAIFLLTDGNWNDGGSPYTMAEELRNKGIEIFGIGVGGGIDFNVLNRIATSGRAFRYSSFNQFREMAYYLRGDPYEKDWLIESQSKCSNCDPMAKCACGLLSGEYKCACPLGYYGSGYVGDCKPCPVSTYKSFVGFAKSCTECPKDSIHPYRGSFRKSDCKCKTGYDGNPGNDSPCTILDCGKPPVPTNGQIRAGTCKTTHYLSTCEVVCKEGFELTTGSGVRTCQLDQHGNAHWSGKDPTCKEITCPALKVPNAYPEEGTCVPRSRAYKTKCTMTCKTGYILKGSSVRTCQLDKTWSGQTGCEEVRCPKLNTIPLTQVNPPECVENDMRFFAQCSFTCPEGYVMSGTSKRGLVRSCSVSGQWDNQDRTCVDVTPPTIKCPFDTNLVIRNTSYRLPHAVVSWSTPVHSDNSLKADPLADLTLTSDFTSPHNFKIGQTKVTYKVKDKANHESSCTFIVLVKDKEAPQMTSCPEDQSHELVGQSKLRVTWKTPTFSDNSGLQVSVEPDIRPGTELPLGDHIVHYTAKDESQNANYSCEFKISIQAKTCPVTKPPRNGALACNAFGAANSYCQVSCNNKYDFAEPPGGVYLCSNGQWQAFPAGKPFPWPDCSVRYDPQKAGFRMQTAFYYYEGDCNSPDAQLQIKNNFMNLLRYTGILAMFGKTCSEAECNAENINVYCGATDASKRRRRSAAKEMYIKLDMVAKEKPSKPKTVKELEQVLETKSRPAVDSRVKSTDWSPLRVSDGLDYKSYTLSHADAYCSDQGAVVGKCDSYQTGCDGKIKPQSLCSCNLASGSIEKCIRCPAGTYYDSLHEKCLNCNPGTFQNKEGRFECHDCPEGTWTVGKEAKNFTACREKCKPGYFSPNGLARCFPCPRGTFATGYMNKQCTVCPQGTTTLIAGATAREDCGMKCAPGTYSSSGVEPCKPCAKGTFQNGIGSISCKDCTGTLSTYGPGSDSQSMCVAIDDCASSPCNNGGRCVDQKDGFTCECTSGFVGKQCEVEQDECLSDPCYQGSTCVNKVNGYECVCSRGYTGKNCDVPLSLCSPNPCQNGAKCIPQAPNVLCECPKGYEGLYCEVKIDFCKSTPCLNGGLCQSLGDSFKCTCRPGFTGSQCELQSDKCSSNPCLNDGACKNEVNMYRCTCKKGYAGSRCQTRVVNCYPDPCQNGACVEKTDRYECLCQPNYAGKTCQTKVSTDYDVTFPSRLATSSSSVTNIPDLQAFTVAFWLRTTDSENPGTPISYSSKVNGKVIDNALVIQDYGAFSLHINNEKHFIGVSANDGHWHHVAVTWRNTDGRWVFYLDGETVKSSSVGFQVKATIKGGGVMVLGQEQDDLGDGFSPEEAFIGDLSQVNVWNRVLSNNEVANLASNCHASEGNVKSWGDFLVGLQGVFVKTSRSSVCDFNSKLRDYQFTFESRYPSQDHKVITSKTPEQCAAICESEKSIPCRSFDYERATKKCYLSKAVAAGAGDLIPAKGFDFYQTACLDALGMEAKAIPDSSLSATSSMNGISGPKEARLHNSRVSGVPGLSDSRGGWSPSVNNNNQYLQIDLGRTFRITGIATQGVDSTSEWVSSYKLEHSSDKSRWTYYQSILSGNKDDSTVVRQQVQAFVARYLRVRPQAWNKRISMRAEIYGCSSDIAPLSVQAQCSANHCVNGGTCVKLLHGYRCLCVTGYQGNNCQTASPCKDPGTPPNGRRSSSSFSHGSSVTFTCNAGYRLQGSSTRTCNRGKWSGTAPQCLDVDECSQGHCSQTCRNTDGSYMCACHKGYKLNADGKRCDDINECSMAGICSHTCHNTAGGFRCSCPSGMKLAPGGRSCQDLNECSAGNNGCEQECFNGYLTSTCHCRGGFYLESNKKQCSERQCPSTSAPANGQQSIHGDRILGNVLTISCSPGYKIVGTSSRTCQADGKWSGTQPRCQAVRCPVIGTLKHGQVSVTAGQSYSSKASFSCNHGYDLVGATTRTCQQNGEWSHQQPRCVRADCPSLKAPSHGTIEGIRREIGSTVRVSCITGYRVYPDDGAFRTCTSNNKWTGSDPVCKIVNCGDPGTPWHGYLAGADFTYGQTVTYRCRVKHFLEGDNKRVCGADGKWTGTLPRCLENSCGDPGSPSNGHKTGNDHTYGATVRFSCNKGYDLRGSATRTCQTTGLWDGVQPTCQIKNCGDPGTPVNGHRIGSDFTYGNSLIFDCNPGFQLRGSITRDCQETGTWSGSQPTCVASNCGKIVHGPTGTIQSTNYPNNYPSKEYCTWEIRVPKGKKVRIDFQELRTEAGKDVVYIYDTLKAEPMIAFSGIKDKPRAMTSSGNSLRVRFISNGLNSNNGFKLTYKQTDCGGMLTSKTGEIQSPGFPNGYPASISCTWLVRVLNTRIALKMSEFSSENAYDRLEVAQGPWVTSPLVISWSGPRPLSGSVKTQNYMWLHFYSNSKNDRFYKGFKATYKPYDPYAQRK